MRNIGNLTYEELLEIEDRCNSLQVVGIPIGSSLGKGLQSDLSSSRTGWWEYFKALVLIPRQTLKYTNSLWSKQVTFPHSKENLLLFGLTNHDIRMWAFFIPLLEHLGDFSYLVLGRRKPHNVKIFQDIRILPVGYWKYWSQSYALLKTPLKALLKELRDHYKLDKLSILRVHQLILVQSQRLVAYHQYLSNLNPKALIVDHDRQKLNSCLVLAANKLRIPTFTFIHGSTHPPKAYVPFLANYIFCWGNSHVQQFELLGNARRRLLKVGNSKLPIPIKLEPANIKRRVGLTSDKPICLLATNNINWEFREKLAREYCQALKNQGEWQGLIRLHPIENLADYHQLMDDYPEIRFVSNSELSLQESLSISSVVCIHNSIFGVESLYFKVPVIVLDFIDLPLGIGKELTEEAGALLASNCRELTECLNELMNPSKIKAAIENSSKYLEDNCAHFGQDAAKIIIQAVKAHLELNS